MEWKTLVCFEYKNGKTTMAEYDEFERMAERFNLDIYELLSDVRKGLGAESYTILSSRLLEE